MKIAIIGSGNAGCAHACMMTVAGHEVNLIKTSETLHGENFEMALTQGGLFCIMPGGDNKEFIKLNKITRDLDMGLDGIEVVMIMTQTIYHKKVAKLLTNNIGPTVKMILVIPGYLGSLYFRNIQDTLGDLLLAEGESTPYDARIVSPGTVKILFKNIRNAVAVLPNSKKAKGFELCRELCDTYVKTRTNIIESALHNPNLIVHTVGAVMSAARIEYSHGDFWMYREGFTPSIWRIIEALDNEKNAVIAYYKGIPSPYLEECKFRNEVDFSKDSMAVFNSYAKHGGPKGPDQVDCRFIYEDVSMGLVLLESLGHAAGIDTTITSSLINIASALTAKDYRTIGRNLSDLSLDLKDKSLLDDIFNGD